MYTRTNYSILIPYFDGRQVFSIVDVDAISGGLPQIAGGYDLPLARTVWRTPIFRGLILGHFGVRGKAILFFLKTVFRIDDNKAYFSKNAIFGHF